MEHADRSILFSAQRRLDTDRRPWSTEAVLVVVLAVGQVVSPALVTAIAGRGIGDTPGDTPLLTPADYAFLIWLPITVGSLAYAVFQLLPGQRERSFYPALRRPALVLFALFTLWLIAAVNDWLWATVAIFLTMQYCLWKILPVVLADRLQLTTLDRALTAIPFSLYTGWTTIAIFANIAAAFAYSGLPVTGTAGLPLQGVLLAGATINALYGIWRTKGDLVYVGVIAWAIGGVIVRHLPTALTTAPSVPIAMTPERAMVIGCALACAVVTGFTVFVRRMRRSR